MAFETTSHTHDLHSETVVVTATANTDNDSYDFQLRSSPIAMSLHAQGADFGSGTAAVQGSNDGTNFAALPTAVSLTANGIKSIALADLGYSWYRIDLSGATNPTVSITVHARF